MKFGAVVFSLFTLILTSNALATENRDLPAASKIAAKYLVQDAVVYLQADALLTSIAEEAKACGLGRTGPQCLDSAFISVNAAENYIETGSSFVFFSVFRDKGSNRFFGLATEVAKDIGVKAPGGALIYSYNREVNSEKVKADYQQNVRQALEASTPDSQMDFSVKSICQTQNPKSLFHFAELLSKGNNDQIKISLDEINQNYPLITQHGSQAYQLALIKLIRIAFPKERDLAARIATDLIAINNANISQLAAITLAEQGLSKSPIKEKVIDALTNNEWQYRQWAIYALNTIKNSSDDENLLIGKLLDVDSDVKAAALEVVQQFELDNENLPALSALVRNAGWKNRQDGLNLISKIKTLEATSLILDRFDDSDSDVRNTAVALIQARGLTQRELPQLMRLATSANADTRELVATNLGRFTNAESLATLTTLANDAAWKVRQAAIDSISKNPSSAATIALIAKLGEEDNDVKNAVVAALQERALSNQELAALRVYLIKPTWTVRQMALNYIAKINTPEATDAILPSVTDSDADVRKTAMMHLQHRVLGETEVTILSNFAEGGVTDGRQNVIKCLSRVMSPAAITLLIKMTRDPEWAVRQDAVKAIAPIQTSEVTTALIDRLSDTDNDVKNSAITALAGRAFDETHVAQFAVLLSNNGWEMRQKAANYLGTTKSKAALKVLSDRLAIETDADVITEIRAAIQAIRGRLG